jgi:hypothetical protein
MTIGTAVPPDADVDVRWRDWQARGAAADRRSAVMMRSVSVVVSIGLAVWLLVQLV